MQARKAFIIALFLFVLTIFQRSGYAQDEVIRVDSNLVTVPATVFDRDGRYVTNLKKEDFHVFEDGVEQEIEFFEPVESSITVYLLLDVSGSVTEYAAEIANAASVFIKQLRPDDQVSAATFAYNVRELFQAKKVKDINKRIKVQQFPGDPGTLVYNAVEFAIKKIKKNPGRKAIILFSDGVNDGSAESATSNLREAEEQEASIYTVQFGAFALPSQYVDKKKFYKWQETANWYVRELAARTGGRHFQLEKISDLSKTFGEIADELGRQYSLGYYPKIEGKKGERRQIKVKVRQPNLAVRARESYVFEESKNKRR